MPNSYVRSPDRCCGAALESWDGQVYVGCAVDIANFSSGVCAPKAALVAAVSAGQRKLTRLAVVGDHDHIGSLCGDCAQSLCEFCKDDIEICFELRGGYTTLFTLYPHLFHAHEHTPLFQEAQ